MAKTNYTRANALTDAIAACETQGMTQAVEVLSRMLAQINAASSKPKTETKEQRLNAMLAERVYAWMQEQDAETLVSTVSVRDAFTPEILTTQKASAILSVLLKSGRVVKTLDKGRVFYKMA